MLKSPMKRVCHADPSATGPVNAEHSDISAPSYFADFIVNFKYGRMQVRNFAADLSAMRFIYADIALRRADADFDYYVFREIPCNTSCAFVKLKSAA